jgi:uncharacterized protein YprB with RNaseH-like and TPR domain
VVKKPKEYPYPRILLWDLETTDLNADWGRLICMGWKWLDKKRVHLLKDVDYGGRNQYGLFDDSKLVLACRDILEQADAWVTHFGTYFDIPFLNARLLHHGYSPLPQDPLIRQEDTWFLAKRGIKIKSRHLDRIAKHIGTKAKKTLVEPEIWLKASAGYKPALKYIYEHCRKDILVLEEVFLALRPFSRKLPNYNLFTNTKGKPVCPTCGSEDHRPRGYSYAKVTVSPRFTCRSCGRWFQGKPERRKGVELR